MRTNQERVLLRVRQQYERASRKAVGVTLGALDVVLFENHVDELGAVDAVLCRGWAAVRDLGQCDQIAAGLLGKQAFLAAAYTQVREQRRWYCLPRRGGTVISRLPRLRVPQWVYYYEAGPLRDALARGAPGAWVLRAGEQQVELEVA